MDFTEKNALVSMILTYEMFAVPLAAFFAAVLSGLGGFGGAFLLIIVLTPIVGVKAVIPLISVFAACNNLSRVFIYRKEIVWRTAIYFTLASLPGVYFGAKLLEWMSESLLLLILGLILIFAIPLGRKLKKTDFRSGNKTIFAFGAIYGLVSGAAAGTGMLVVAGLNSAGLRGAVLLGTDAIIGFFNGAMRAGVYSFLGLLTPTMIGYALLMGLLTLPGNWVASKIVRKMGDNLHSKFLEVLIGAGGVWFIYKSFRDFWVYLI